MESGVARRVFSSVSYIDFSWRNRVAAWEGALQLMSGSGWLGYGWGQPQRFYSSYYLPEHIIEGGAFGLNDYLTLGATLGVPALLCFGMYIWLSLAGGGHKHLVKKPDGDKRGQISLASKDSGRIKAMCQSAAIVMLVGFWFDGGLFKLPTAALFWIVLELGKENSSVTSTERIAECHVKTASM
jgi:O-antigen ligase